MSAEKAAVEAPQAVVDQNAQAAEDAKKMLAELQGESAQSEKTNGTTEDHAANKEKDDSTPKKDDDALKHPDRRSDRGGRGRGGMKNRNFRDNIKSDLTTQEESNDPVEIRKQVEFYFSDSNLPNDKFLLTQVGGSKNNPVELKTIHSFKRMRHFQPFEAIVEAMRESKFLELTENDTCVKRREPLPEALNDNPDPDAVKVFEDRAMPRSIYAKGFGDEVPSTQFDIEAFFAPYGPTNAVRLRRTDTKLFKGSVFVEFETEELQEAFLALDPKPQYKGRDLQIMSKKEYCDKKVDDIKTGKIRGNAGRGGFRGHRGDHRGGRDGKRRRDDNEGRDWRERRDEDRKNGFRDDRRRGNRDRDSRGGKPRPRQVDTDEKGIPTIKSSAEDDNKGKREAERADAIAKARAAVEADATTGSKRAREDDGSAVGPESKKIDSKSEAQSVNGSS